MLKPPMLFLSGNKDSGFEMRDQNVFSLMKYMHRILDLELAV